MKVFLLITHISPLLGMERSALRLEEQLRTHHDVEIVVVGASEKVLPGFTNLSVLGSEVSGMRRLLTVPRIHRFARGLDREDTVILVGVWTAIPWLLRFRRGARSIVWEHTLLKEKLSFSWKLRVLDSMARRLYGRADAVVAVSDAVAEDLREYRKVSAVSVIPNYISEEYNLKKNRDETKVVKRILCVGSLSRIKAQNLALDTLTLLPDDFTLRLVGTGPLEATLRERAETLRIQDRVEFCGFLGQEAIRREMDEALLLLHTSVAETFGLVLVEAASRQLPVLSVDTRTSRWLIPEYVPGWTTLPRPEAIAGMIERLAPLSDKMYEAAENKRRIDFDPVVLTAAWQKVLDATGRSAQASK